MIATTFKASMWWLLAALVVGSAIGIYYYLRVMTTLFLRHLAGGAWMPNATGASIRAGS